MTHSVLLRIVFNSVVIVKVIYASPAWWCFANLSDIDRLEAFVRCCIRLKLHQQDNPTAIQLLGNMDDSLFEPVLANDHHVLFLILTDRNNHSHSLRPRHQ